MTQATESSAEQPPFVFPDVSNSSHTSNSVETRTSPSILVFGVTQADRESWEFYAGILNVANNYTSVYLSLDSVINSTSSALSALRRSDILLVFLEGDSLKVDLPELPSEVFPTMDIVALLVAIPSIYLASSLPLPLAHARIVDAGNVKDFAEAFHAMSKGVSSGQLQPARVLADAVEQWIATDSSISKYVNLADKAESDINDSSVDNEEKSSQFKAQSPEFAGLDDSHFTINARAAIQIARRLGVGRQERRTSVNRLLTAIISTGAEVTEANAGTWLLGQLHNVGDSVVKGLTARYPLFGRHTSSELLKLTDSVANRMTAGFRGVLDVAADLARNALGAESEAKIGIRHLVAAILKKNGPGRNAQATLAEFGVDIDQLCAALLAALPTWGLDDNLEAWQRFFNLPLKATSQLLLPRYDSDSTFGQDRIGILREVEAIASLVSAWSIEPPLSIGLFGEWGSGKSFFMQKIRERVRQISAKARESGVAQKEFGYYKNICQVEFNAWHYAEGNLEASLVEHIFQNLKISDQEDSFQVEARQKALLTEMDVQQEIVSAATVKAEKLTKGLKDADAKVNQAKQAVTEIAREQANVTAKDILESVVGAPELKTEIARGLEQIGIKNAQIESLEAARGAIAEATSTVRLIGSGIRIVRENRQGPLLLVWALAAVIVTGMVAWGTHKLLVAPSIVKIIVDAASASAAFVGTAVVSWRSFKPYLKPLLDAVDSLKGKRDLLEQRIEEAVQAQRAKVAQLDNEKAQLQQSVVAAEKDKSEAEQKLRELRTRLDDLNPGQLIAKFIQDRSGTDEYRKHLSVTARIRHDFEKLAAMFKRQRAVEEQGKDGLDFDGKPLHNRNDPLVVNRIILYIDDLDRCQPTQVVAVLQMIHLLLAFPLFVVIVAVDARWVAKSLTEKYALMLSGNDAGPKDGDHVGQTTDGQGIQLRSEYRSATPDDYLEKIFQIPFWIRPMQDDACVKLVRALTSSDVANAASSRPAPHSPTLSKADDGSTRVVPNHSSQSLIPTDHEESTLVNATLRESLSVPPIATASSPPPTLNPEWTEIEPKPRALQLTHPERDYMVRMAPLIGKSPRAVKRFINCYRVLKSMLDSTEPVRNDENEDFKARMVLLGLLTGFPDLAHKMLSQLLSNSRDAAAWSRIATTELGRNQPEKSNLFASLMEEIPIGEHDDLTRLKEAASLVERFSFTCWRTYHKNR